MKNIFSKIAELQKENKPFVLATLVNTSESVPQHLGAKVIILPDGKTFGTIGGGCLEKNAVREAQKLLASGENKVVKITYDLTIKKNSERGITLGMLCGGQAEIMFEALVPSNDLVICGGGHIGEKLAVMCDILGFSYAVIDNRQEFADEKRFPNASKVVCKKFSSALKETEITGSTAIVIITYGHLYDYECIKAAMKTPAYYIGMIGSKTKVGAIFDRLKKERIKITDKVYSPIGLDVGSETPAGIALSIIAEILKVKNKTTGKSLRIQGNDRD
ncbi:MAG: XdhC/CoxI family protein [Elusimicrobiota bacterium]